MARGLRTTAEMPTIPWRRRWCESVQWRQLWCESGFLQVSTDAEAGKLGLWSLDEIADRRVVVLAGEGGLGKTEAIKAEVARLVGRGDSAVKHDAKTYQPGYMAAERLWQTTAVSLLQGRPVHVFIDALDEASQVTPGQFAQALCDRIAGCHGDEQLRVQLDRLRVRLAGRPHLRDEMMEAAAAIGEALGAGRDDVLLLDLQPLTREDVERAAQAWLGGRASRFRAVALEHRAMGPLACRPVTLAMLARLLLRDVDLPSDPAGLYRAGMAELLHPKVDRRSTADAHMQLLVARAVAAVSLLSGRRTITAGATPATAPTDMLTVGDLAELEIDGERVRGPDVVELTEETRLLVRSDVAQTVSWSHASFAEFLAAEHLCHHEPADVLPLLARHAGAGRRVPPSLRRLAGWLALLDGRYAERLASVDAHALLAADAQVLRGLAEDRKRALIGSVIEDIERYRRRVDIERDAAIALRYPGLQTTLARALQRRGGEPLVTRLLLNLAAKFELAGLSDLLLGIATDDEREIAVRCEAIDALGPIADTETQSKVLAIARGAVSRLHEDLHLAVIECVSVYFNEAGILDREGTWRDLPDRRRSVSMALRSRLQQAIASDAPDELKAALEWSARSAGPSWDADLITAIAIRAWEELPDDKAVAVGLAESLLPRLRRHEIPEPLIERASRAGEAPKARRRRLVSALVELVATADDRQQVRMGEPVGKLCTPDDTEWLLGKLEGAARGDERHAWAGVLSWLVIMQPVHRARWQGRVEALWDAGCRAVHSAFLETTVKGPSVDEVARRERFAREAQDRRESLEREGRDAERRLRDLLATPGATDWPELLVALQRHHCHARNHLQDELERAELWWLDASPRSRRALLNSARAFLVSAATVDHPHATVRAARMLQQEEPDWLTEQLADHWKTWLSAVLRWAVRRDYAELKTTLIDAIRAHDADGLRCHLAESLDSPAGVGLAERLLARDPLFVDSLLSRLESGGTLTQASYLLPRVVLLHGRDVAHRLVGLVNDRELSDEVRLAAAQAVAIDCSFEDWRGIRAWVMASEERALTVLGGQRLTRSLHRRTTAPFVEGLRTPELATFLAAVLRRFPARKRHTMSAGAVRDDEIRYWDIDSLINKVVGRLVEAGEAGIGALERVAARFPGRSWLRDAAASARQEVLENIAEWPDPQFVVAALNKPGRRYVSNTYELCDAVADSIERWAAGVVEPPRNTSLFYEDCRGEGRRPKLETGLSDVLRFALEPRLQDRRVVVNREVQIQAPGQGGVGQNLDLFVQTLAHGGTGSPLFTLPVEVKRSLHREVHRNMADQLLGRYMRGMAEPCGVYVVFFFPPDDRTNSALRDFESARRFLRGQAEELSGGRVHIRAVLVDARTGPEKTG